MKYTSANNPNYNGMVPHLRCKAEDIGQVVLMPGDPGRVLLFEKLLDDFKIVSQNREFVVAKGNYKRKNITICSTGIGAPSTEIAVIELIELGAKALIRIGGTGVLKENINCGDFIINTAAVRLGGSSIFYARPEYPAVASFEAVACLKQSCLELDTSFHLGIGASIGSFYRGQGRSILDQEKVDCSPSAERLLDEFKFLNVLNIEMEAETIFTLSSIYNVMAGSICVAHCNRVTNQWLLDYEESQQTLCLIALESALKIQAII